MVKPRKMSSDSSRLGNGERLAEISGLDIVVVEVVMAR